MDESVFRDLNHAGSNLGLDIFMVALTILAMTYILVFAGPVLWWKKHRELGFDVIVLVIVSDLVSEALKLLFMRERPIDVLDHVNTLSWGPFTTATSLSFPSGHASRTFAMATLIAFGTRRHMGVAMFVFAALVSLSRIYLGLHWPSDVLAGAVLGIVLALMLRWVGRRDNTYTRKRARAIAWLRGLKRPGQSAKQGQSS